MAEKSILLVEDDEVDIMAFQRLFRKMGLTNPIEVANDGEEALQKLRGDGKVVLPMKPPYRIVLDLNMPRMSGFEFLRELRRDPNLKAAEVIILTTSHLEEDRTQAYEHKVVDFFRKSILQENPQKLLSAILA